MRDFWSQCMHSLGGVISRRLMISKSLNYMGFLH